MDELIYQIIDANQSEITWWGMAIRGIIIFIFSLLMIKVGGKRIFSRYGSFDIVLSIILGAILAKSIVGSAKFIPTLFTALVLSILHRILAKLTIHHNFLAGHIKGSPALLYKNGNFIQDEMERHNISIDDVMEALRFQAKKGDFKDVLEIYLERNGKISFIIK